MEKEHVWVQSLGAIIITLEVALRDLRELQIEISREMVRREAKREMAK